MRRTLTTLVVSAALALTGGAAHAATQDTQVKITISSTTTTCDNDKPIIHATLHNDTTNDETAVVYLEPNAGGNTIGVAVGSGQVTVPKNGSTAVALPYGNGNAVFIAVAVTGGGTVPTMNADLKNPGVAYQELFPADSQRTNTYPAAPTARTPSPQTGCPPNWPINPYPIVDPACVPHPTVTVTQTVTATKQIPGPTVTKTLTTNVTATTTMPGSTTTVTRGGPFLGDQAVSSTSVDTAPVATGEKLAHTGASVVLPIVAAVALLFCGASMYMFGRRRARRH